MAKRKEPLNPFYVALVVVGVAFVVTACAFTLLLLQQNRTTAASEFFTSNPLMRLVRDRGMTVIAIEVAVLAVASFAAMWLDSYRTRRELSQSHRPSDPSH